MLECYWLWEWLCLVDWPMLPWQFVGVALTHQFSCFTVDLFAFPLDLLPPALIQIKGSSLASLWTYHPKNGENCCCKVRPINLLVKDAWSIANINIVMWHFCHWLFTLKEKCITSSKSMTFFSRFTVLDRDSSDNAVHKIGKPYFIQRPDSRGGNCFELHFADNCHGRCKWNQCIWKSK